MCTVVDDGFIKPSFFKMLTFEKIWIEKNIYKSKAIGSFTGTRHRTRGVPGGWALVEPESTQAEIIGLFL